jgi:hypothetical protein
MSRTPTSSGAHCAEHERQCGSCPGCQRARIAAAREQLALVMPVKQAAPVASSPSRSSLDRLPVAA